MIIENNIQLFDQMQKGALFTVNDRGQIETETNFGRWVRDLFAGRLLERNREQVLQRNQRLEGRMAAILRNSFNISDPFRAAAEMLKLNDADRASKSELRAICSGMYRRAKERQLSKLGDLRCPATEDLVREYVEKRTGKSIDKVPYTQKLKLYGEAADAIVALNNKSGQGYLKTALMLSNDVVNSPKDIKDLGDRVSASLAQAYGKDAADSGAFDKHDMHKDWSALESRQHVVSLEAGQGQGKGKAKAGQSDRLLAEFLSEIKNPEIRKFASFAAVSLGHKMSGMDHDGAFDMSLVNPKIDDYGGVHVNAQSKAVSMSVDDGYLVIQVNQKCRINIPTLGKVTLGKPGDFSELQLGKMGCTYEHILRIPLAQQLSPGQTPEFEMTVARKPNLA